MSQNIASEATITQGLTLTLDYAFKKSQEKARVVYLNDLILETSGDLFSEDEDQLQNIGSRHIISEIDHHDSPRWRYYDCPGFTV